MASTHSHQINISYFLNSLLLHSKAVELPTDLRTELFREKFWIFGIL